MIRALVMANDLLLADGIAAMLAQEINLNVSLLTPSEPGKGDHPSVLILVDEGQSGDEFIFHFLRRKRVSNVTPWIGFRRSSGFDV